MKSKVFKTLDEQVEILRGKGLIIDDVDFTKDVLLRENYFFINGYRHLFLKSQKNKVFIPGTTFSELYAMFNFDRQIRNILFKNILIIENNAKSIFSYVLSKKYGYKEKNYLDVHNFNNSKDKVRQVNDLLKKMKRQIRVNGSQHSATVHYINNYGYVPLWIVVKVLSFGIISEFYTILKPEDQDEIADIYKLNSSDLLIYLPILSNYRNLCAHEDILYENKTQKIISNTIYHKLLNIEKVNDEYKYGKNDLFALLIIMKHLLTNDEIKNIVIEIDHALENLDYNLHSIPISKVMDRMGFPMNWKDIANIEKE